MLASRKPCVVGVQLVPMDPKGGELFLRELTPVETLVRDSCDTDVQFVHFTWE